MKRLWWFICDCLFGSPWAITELQARYQNSQCPCCRKPISHDAIPGDECPECGHLLWLNESLAQGRKTGTKSAEHQPSTPRSARRSPSAVVG
jgi:hypothetical protein